MKLPVDCGFLTVSFQAVVIDYESNYEPKAGTLISAVFEERLLANA